jgi:hypothetical protein
MMPTILSQGVELLEGLLEFSPRDLMSGGNHGLEIIPPYQHCTTELEGSEAGLTLLGAGQGEHRELGLNGPDPRIGNQWLLGLFKSRGASWHKNAHIW